MINPGNSPRRFAPPTTVPDLDAETIPDLVKRRFDAGALNAVWASDITYLRTGEGWLHLCAVRDGHSRRVIGWAISDGLHTDLVGSAVAMAVTLRGDLPEHNSAQMARVARPHNLASSVGRTGVCWDNAATESLWAALKVKF